MNEIVQHSCPRNRIAFFEEIRSHGVKNLGCHTIDEWNNDVSVIFGDNENFAGRIYWDIDGSRTVSNIYEEQSLNDSGYSMGKDYFLFKLVFKYQSGEIKNKPTKYFLHEISVCRRNFEFP